MGETAVGDIIAGTDSCDKNCKEHLELLHLQAGVELDGSSALLSIHTTQGQVDMSISIEQMSATLAEMREAGSIMMHRQLRAMDRGRSAFEQMMRGAPKPATITSTIDRDTGERVILYRFTDRMAFSVRLTQDQIQEALDDIASEMKRQSH